jgi:hypothetical protein
MNTKLSKKLVLNRETLQPLQSDVLDNVQGGVVPTGPQGSGIACSDCMSIRCSRVSVPTSRPTSAISAISINTPHK